MCVCIQTHIYVDNIIQKQVVQNGLKVVFYKTQMFDYIAALLT